MRDSPAIPMGEKEGREGPGSDASAAPGWRNPVEKVF